MNNILPSPDSLSALPRDKTVCFSGHRPQKLPQNPNARNILRSLLFAEIERRISNGFTHFISGCALGVDLWAAEMVLDLRANNSDLKLICAVPYTNHSARWLGEQKWQLNCVLEAADVVNEISSAYNPGCLRKRNFWMVDNSSALVAVCSEFKSGTGQTIAYARRCGLDITVIDASLGT